MCFDSIRRARRCFFAVCDVQVGTANSSGFLARGGRERKQTYMRRADSSHVCLHPNPASSTRWAPTFFILSAHEVRVCMHLSHSFSIYWKALIPFPAPQPHTLLPACFIERAVERYCDFLASVISSSSEPSGSSECRSNPAVSSPRFLGKRLVQRARGQINFPTSRAPGRSIRDPFRWPTI